MNRYLEVDFHLREVEKELDKFDPPQRQHLEKLFLQYLSEAIDLDRDNDLIFQGMESFRVGSKGSIQKMKDLIQKYQERKRREYWKTEKDLLSQIGTPGHQRVGGPAQSRGKPGMGRSGGQI